MANPNLTKSQLRVKPDGYLDYTLVHLDIEEFHKPYNFEKIDWQWWGTWVHKHWEAPLIISTIYVILIFSLKHWMRNRKPFDLRFPLFFWNSALGIFSIFGFYRIFQGFTFFFDKPDILYRYSCTLTGASSTIMFWGFCFGMSKVVELGDTIFLVLRKKPLQFIHWYHHIMTLTGTALGIPYGEPLAKIYGLMNFGVHSLMYPYFALAAIGIKVPRKLANVITTLQLTQMAGGCFFNVYTAVLYYKGGVDLCYRNEKSIQLATVIYGSFLVLFGKLFFDLVLNYGKSVKKKQL